MLNDKNVIKEMTKIEDDLYWYYILLDVVDI